MIFPNAYISSTDINGNPKIHKRKIQIDQLYVNRDPGFVEIRADASSALAPLIDKLAYDLPIANKRQLYTRGDLITIIREDGVAGDPPANPFHVMRVQAPGNPFPATELWLTRADMLFQDALWMQAITANFPGAVPDEDWDDTLKQTKNERGPSWGRGWMYTDPESGVTYHGYMPARPVKIAINDYATQQISNEYGYFDYEHPVVLVEMPQTFSKWDILVLADGNRLVIGDLYHKVQRFGVTIITIYQTELRSKSNYIYDIPLTGG